MNKHYLLAATLMLGCFCAMAQKRPATKVNVEKIADDPSLYPKGYATIALNFDNRVDEYLTYLVFMGGYSVTDDLNVDAKILGSISGKFFGSFETDISGTYFFTSRINAFADSRVVLRQADTKDVLSIELAQETRFGGRLGVNLQTANFATSANPLGMVVEIPTGTQTPTYLTNATNTSLYLGAAMQMRRSAELDVENYGNVKYGHSLTIYTDVLFGNTTSKTSALLAQELAINGIGFRIGGVLKTSIKTDKLVLISNAEVGKMPGLEISTSNSFLPFYFQIGGGIGFSF